MKKSLLKGSFLVISLLVCSSIYMHAPKEVTTKDSTSRACLIEALAHEALNQPIEGQKAVLDVIKNRVQDKRFPSTYCKVVHQKYAFSYRNEIKAGTMKAIAFKNRLDKEAVLKIENLVDFFLKGEYTPVLSTKVMWYTRTEVKTVWMKKMKTEVVLGSHKFLKES